MSTLTRFNPFRSMARFDPTAEFDDLFRNFPLRPLMRDMETTLSEMRMDVQEDDAGYRVTLDVPGARKEDIEVSVDGSRVTVQAVVKREEKHEGKDLHVERYSGRTYRSFTLPQEIDRENCNTHYENGVLTLTLPRKGEGQAKRLTVN